MSVQLSRNLSRGRRGVPVGVRRSVVKIALPGVICGRVFGCVLWRAGRMLHGTKSHSRRGIRWHVHVDRRSRREQLRVRGDQRQRRSRPLRGARWLRPRGAQRAPLGRSSVRSAGALSRARLRWVRIAVRRTGSPAHLPMPPMRRAGARRRTLAKAAAVPAALRTGGPRPALRSIATICSRRSSQRAFLRKRP
jgi:hypothetical protein